MPILSTDLYALHSFSQPLLVPDGALVVDNWLDASTNSAQSTIRYYQNHQASLTLGYDHQHDTAPQWHHGQLAFLSQAKDQTTQIFTQSLSGEPAQQRSRLPLGVTKFRWAPDGSGFYLQSPCDHTAKSDLPHATRLTRLHIQSNGVGLRQEAQTTAIHFQSFDATPSRLIKQSPHSLSLMAITANTLALAYESDHQFNADHSPATNTVLFDLTTHQTQPIFSGRADAVSFSPDGQKLLFVGDPGDGTALSNTLFIYDRQTQGVSELFAEAPEVGNWIITDSQPNLSNTSAGFIDDTHVMFQYSTNGQVHLAVSDLAGRWYKLDTPDGTISDFNFDGDDFVYTYTNFTTPSQLWCGQTLIADANATWVQTHPLQTPRPFSFSRASTVLHGWYLPPVTAESKYPAILSVHGGPHGAYGNAFFHELQVFASHGFGVIFINPRGSATYGHQFLAGNLKDYGGQDYQDLMAAVDHALQLDAKIDPQRLLMTGGSYGGFMANWMLTHTDRFAAIIAQRGISDWFSYNGTSDIGFYFKNLELGPTRADWWRQSPIASIKQAHTPLLLMHSEADLRVPIGQSEEMYTALKLQGAPVEFLRFPQSDHDLSRTGLPNLRIERLDAMLEWFNRYA